MKPRGFDIKHCKKKKHTDYYINRNYKKNKLLYKYSKCFLWLIEENAVDSFNTLLFARYEGASDSLLTVTPLCYRREPRVRKPAKRTLSPRIGRAQPRAAVCVCVSVTFQISLFGREKKVFFESSLSAFSAVIS